MGVAALALLFAAAALLGCVGRGGETATPIPEPTESPSPTVMPAVTSVEVVRCTRKVQKEQGSPAWVEPMVFGCAEAGTSYAYRVVGNGTEIIYTYSVEEGGQLDGADTVLITLAGRYLSVGSVRVVSEGYADEISDERVRAMLPSLIAVKEWRAKEGCRCLRRETVVDGRATPEPCPARKGGYKPTVTSAEEEVISTAAYTGPTIKYHYIVELAGGERKEGDVWIAPGIPVPVRAATSWRTLELLNYSSWCYA